jgi:hypothetical protein
MCMSYIKAYICHHEHNQYNSKSNCYKNRCGNTHPFHIYLFDANKRIEIASHADDAIKTSWYTFAPILMAILVSMYILSVLDSKVLQDDPDVPRRSKE